MLLPNDDLTRMIESLREDAAKSVERLIAQKLEELESFKLDAIRNAELHIADKILQLEEEQNGGRKQSPIPPPLPNVSASNTAYPPPPPPPPPILNVKTPSLDDLVKVTKKQIKLRPISVPVHSKKYKQGIGWNVLLVFLALEFALGFGVCHWWWSQWESKQPKIFLKPNDRGVFVSPESLRSFYDEIKSNADLAQIEAKWKRYEPKFTSIGSVVETQLDENKSNFLIRVDDWVIHLKFNRSKIAEKALLLFFEHQLSVFKTLDNDNQIRVYLLDSVRFDDIVTEVIPPKSELVKKTEIIKPAEIAAEGVFFLTQKIRPEIAKVGLGKAAFRTYSSFQRVFERSINAHAPSQYVFRLERKWKTFKSVYGLKLDTKINEAHCVFIVKADDRELFRSEEIHDAAEHVLEVDVNNVDKLELIVEAVGNNTNDCAVWFAPMLFQ